MAAYGQDKIYECPVTVENEADMLKAVEDVRKAECNALVVFLGNFGPETPETLIAKMCIRDRRSMWFNSKQREEPYQVLTSSKSLRD